LNNNDFNGFANHCTQNDEFFGEITDPSSAAHIKGPCGGDMEFYLLIKDDIIIDVKYYTETGCCNTKTAGRSVAKRVIGKNIIEALAVNPYQIISEELRKLTNLPYASPVRICSIRQALWLAVSLETHKTSSKKRVMLICFL